MSEGVILSPHSADRVRGLLQRSGGPALGSGHGGPRPDVVWVKCTGSLGGDGRYPGEVDIYYTGVPGWSTIVASVKLQPATADSTLQNGARYPATRAANDSAGAAVFVTLPDAGEVITGGVPAWGGGLVNTTTQVYKGFKTFRDPVTVFDGVPGDAKITLDTTTLGVGGTQARAQLAGGNVTSGYTTGYVQAAPGLFEILFGPTGGGGGGRWYYSTADANTLITLFDGYGLTLDSRMGLIAFGSRTTGNRYFSPSEICIGQFPLSFYAPNAPPALTNNLIATADFGLSAEAANGGDPTSYGSPNDIGTNDLAFFVYRAQNTNRVVRRGIDGNGLDVVNVRGGLVVGSGGPVGGLPPPPPPRG